MAFQPFPILGRSLRRGLGSSGRGGGGTVYTLLDQFTTPRAAGAINGTPAEPTGQTRTVADTNGIMSISGGEFIVNGTPALADRLNYGNFARVLGRVAVIKFNDIAAGSTVYIGWNSATQQENGIRLVAGVLRLVDVISMTSGIAVGVYSPATYYQLVVDLRTAGAYVFMKGGAFTFWNLIGYSSGNTNSNISPGTFHTAAACNFKMDDIRIPPILYIPPVLAYDTFTRADGALGSTETSGSDGQVAAAIAWGTPTGTWVIGGNKASATVLSGGLAIATIVLPTKDNWIEAALTRAGGIAGVVGRYTDASNYIYAYHDGTNAGIKQRLAAVETDLIAATAATFVASAVLRMEMDGNNCILFYNNVRIGATGTINAALSAAVDGIYTTNTGNTFDNVLSLARGTSGEYEAALNAFAA